MNKIHSFSEMLLQTLRLLAAQSLKAGFGYKLKDQALERLQ